MDSLVVPTVISIEDDQHLRDDQEGDQEDLPNHQVYRPFRRQISLRDRQRSKKSFFSNARSGSPNPNFARRMASSWRRRKSIKGGGPEEDTATLKTGSTTSSPFSWLPHRSPKRQWRAKSEGAHWDANSKSSSASSPSEEMTLQSLCSRNSSRLPLFFTKCLDFIEANGGIQMEGIYRVPGNQSQVAELEKAFRKSDKVDLEALNIPVHATATALKKFLDVLPEPLIPVSSHEAILASLELPVQSPTYMDDSPASTTSAVDQHTERIKRLQQVVGEVVPPLNRHVLRHLAQHLKKVAASSSTNSMDFRNLAKVWGPTLFRPNFDSFEMMASSLARFELAAYVMLSNCDSIFLPCLV